jgi:hypothetical protein
MYLRHIEDDNQPSMNPYSTRPHCNTPVSRLLVAATLALTCAVPAQASDKKAPPAKPAAEYPANDPHPAEHVTIAIDPCDNQKDCDFFRLPYVAHSLIPVRLIITNDGDTAISLEDARMQFISADNDKIPAADLEEINRRMFTFKSTKGTKIPIIPITIHHEPIDKKITQDDADFGFQSTTVNPHSTLAGYLFYDIKPIDRDYPLKGAQIYVKMIHTADKKHELFAFTIPFDKWLAAQPKPEKPNTNQQK